MFALPRLPLINYDAPHLLLNPDTNRPLVPIFRIKRDWVRASIQCTRTQFPINIAYAITTHKSRGLSVYAAVLNLGKKKDFSPGLTYVSISRVRTLRGIFFEGPFDFNRLKSGTSEMAVMPATDRAKRQLQEMPLPAVDEDGNSENDLPVTPSTFPSFVGCASQIEILIFHSEPVAPSGELRSTATIPSSFFSS
jgi:hypothetical protein